MNAQKRYRCFYCCNIIVPLALGLAIYVLSGADVYIAKYIRQFLHIENAIVLIVPTIRNYGADFLWSYALVFAVDGVLHDVGKHDLLSLIICLSFAVLIELFQKINLISGTFDPMDIFVELVAIAIALQLIKYFEEEKHNEKMAEGD